MCALRAGEGPGCGKVWAEKAYSCFSTSPPTVPGPFGGAPWFLLPCALCAEHPLPFRLDLPLLSHLVEVERKDRELKRRLSREGREGRTRTEVRGGAQPGGTQRMALQPHELHTGSGRWLRRRPQQVMGVPEGCWPGCMGSVQGNCLAASSPYYTCLFSPSEVSL